MRLLKPILTEIHDASYSGVGEAGPSAALALLTSVGKVFSSAVGSLSGVNLGALEFVGVVDVDGFPGGVEVEGSGSAFAVAVAGLLDTAEGEVNFGSDSWGVDVGDAGLEVADGAESLVHVAGVESGGKAVLDAVGGFDGFVEVCNFNEADDGAEDLFAGDAHFRFYGAEDGGGEEVAFVEGSVFERVAAGEELGSFFFSDFDVAGGSVDLLLVDLRAHLDEFVEAVAYFEGVGAGDEFFGEFVGDFFVENDAAGGGAALAGGSEGSPDGSVEGEFDVGIFEDDHRVFAAHFERSRLEVGGGGLADHAAYFAGTGEGDGADTGMSDQRGSGVGAEAGEDVDDA